MASLAFSGVASWARVFRIPEFVGSENARAWMGSASLNSIFVDSSCLPGCLECGGSDHALRFPHPLLPRLLLRPLPLLKSRLRQCPCRRRPFSLTPPLPHHLSRGD